MENIDTLIIDRLGEHQRKVGFVQSNLENRNNIRFSFGKAGYTIMSIAACITIIFAIFPLLFKNNSLSDITVSAPSFTEYRSGYGFEEIELLIKKGNYNKALSLVDAELNKNAMEVGAIMAADMNEEEKGYMLALYNNDKEELLWSKIYLLVKLEKEKDLELCCENYLKTSSFLTHRDEVEEILEIIK